MAQSTGKTPATKKPAVPPKAPETAKKAAAPKKAASAKATPKAASAKTASVKETTKAPAKKAAPRATATKLKGNGEATMPKKVVKAPSTIGGITPEQRYRMICDAAYFRAERRGFVGGNAVQDWLDAESEIDELLREMQE